MKGSANPESGTPAFERHRSLADVMPLYPEPISKHIPIDTSLKVDKKRQVNKKINKLMDNFRVFCKQPTSD